MDDDHDGTGVPGEDKQKAPAAQPPEAAAAKPAARTRANAARSGKSAQAPGKSAPAAKAPEVAAPAAALPADQAAGGKTAPQPAADNGPTDTQTAPTKPTAKPPAKTRTTATRSGKSAQTAPEAAAPSATPAAPQPTADSTPTDTQTAPTKPAAKARTTSAAKATGTGTAAQPQPKKAAATKAAPAKRPAAAKKTAAAKARATKAATPGAKPGAASKAARPKRPAGAQAAPPAPPERGPWRVPGYLHEQDPGTDASRHVVVRARHEATGTPVAITYLSAALAGDQPFREAFRSEAEVLGGLESPYVARLYAYVEDGPHAAIVREPVDGAGLDALLTGNGLPVGPESALAVLKGSLLGLAAAHAAGLVHGGYQPSNVLLTAQGTVALVDVGVAPRSAAAATTGTAATDVHAATAAFHTCLTGTAPFAEEPVPVPEAVQPLIARGLAEEPAEQPPGAADFAAELEAVAVAAYGEDWEQRGQHELAFLVAPLLLPPPSEIVPVADLLMPPRTVAFVPADEPPARARFGRRAKILAVAAAVVIVAGALTVTAVATGDSNDAAATVTPTPTATSSPTSAPAIAPATPSPTGTAATSPSAGPSNSPPTSNPPAAPAATSPATAPTTAVPPTAAADPTKPAGSAHGPHVSTVFTQLTCSSRDHTAKAIVRVEYDGTAAGTLHLTWWRSATGKPQGATTMTPQSATFPKGSTSYIFTSNFSFKDNPDRPYIGVTVSSDPAAASGNRTSTVACH